MSEQISILSIYPDEDVAELKEQVKIFQEYANKKRNWENAFQKWSDKAIQDSTTSYGACGYGSMCDWCEDNSYGRPCVRALNDMCREKKIRIDYSDRNFERIWNL